MKWLKIASGVLAGLIVAIFAFMGFLSTIKGTPTHSVRAFGDRAGAPTVQDSLFERTAEMLVHTKLDPGHTVEMVLNGNGTYPRLYADLRGAQRSLMIQLYYCKPGAVADSFKTILSERARAGVRVLFLLDAFGASSLTDEYLDSLKTAGVRTAMFRPVTWHTLHKAQNRSHARVVVIDEKVGYTGGFGLADYWLGDGHHDEQWRDSNVRFTGPAVMQLQAAFAVAWGEATGELLTGRALFGTPAAPDTSSKVVAGLLFSTPSGGGTPGERYLALSIAGAKQRLYITNAYFIPDADQRRFLVAAAKRGVDVRILTAGKKSDVKTVRHAGHATYEELLRGGVRIFEFEPAMLHAKTMVVDGTWSTIGSMNFDNRSAALNDESNLLVNDAAFGRVMEAQFHDDLRYSREFKLPLFTKRSFFHKLLDRGAGKGARLL